MIDARTLLSFTVTGSVREFVVSSYSEADLRSEVLNILSRNVDVERFDLRSNEGFFSQSWTYRAIVTVRTKWVHADRADVAAIVRNAFISASGAEAVVTDGINTQSAPSESGSGLGWSGSLALVTIALVAGAIIFLKVKP